MVIHAGANDTTTAAALSVHARSIGADAVGGISPAYYRLEEEPVRWAVFDPEGRWLGDVETPRGGRVWDIGNDYVLGVWQDALGVQQVRMYRLVKSGGQVSS